MLKWLDCIPLLWAVVGTVWLVLAPFVPEPHLLEKLRMLVNGTLTRPLDMFDLVMHATPVVLLPVLLWRRVKARTASAPQPPQQP
jgi:hypothetical protein